MNPTIEFSSEDIRRMREFLGCSQEEFARILGLTQPTISNWERGKYHPSPLAGKVLRQYYTRIQNKLMKEHEKHASN